MTKKELESLVHEYAHYNQAIQYGISKFIQDVDTLMTEQAAGRVAPAEVGRHLSGMITELEFISQSSKIPEEDESLDTTTLS